VSEAVDAPTSPGRRQRRRERTRALRRRRRRRAALALLVVLLVVAGGWAAWEFVPRPQPAAPEDPAGEPVAVALPDVELPVLTVVTVDALDTTGEGVVGSVAVLGIERATTRGSIVPVPPATQLPVAGHGVGTLAEAYTLGGPALLGDALAGLLEVRSDAVVVVPAGAWEDGVEVLGGDPALAAAIAGDPAEVVDDLAGVARAYLDVVALVAGAEDGLAPALEDGGVSGDEAGLLAAMLVELAEAAATDGLEAEVLPLAGTVEDTGTVTPDRPGVTAMVIDRFSSARTPVAVGAGIALQVLDGTDDDDVLVRVSELLEPVGYEVLLTGNAARSDEPETRIVLQNEEPATLAAARDVRDRLGAGTLERAGNPVTVVDITIVVGGDLP
jgi:hypothetical protein